MSLVELFQTKIYNQATIKRVAFLQTNENFPSTPEISLSTILINVFLNIFSLQTLYVNLYVPSQHSDIRIALRNIEFF